MMAEPQTQGQVTIEQFQRQQQVGMLGAAQMQFVSCISMQPPPSKQPPEVRAQMYQILKRTLGLFKPANAEEAAIVGEEWGAQ